MSNMKKLLLDYKKNKWALPAFNIQNLHQLNALNQACINSNLPAIAQFSSSYIDYFHKMFDFNKVINNFGQNIYFHLDHCDDYNTIIKCVNFGFNSVMYDGSMLDLKSNIINSNYIYKITQNANVLLEVELGNISGIEDNFGTIDNSYFSLDSYKTFIHEANFDLIALGIGNSHGFYKSLINLNIDLLESAFVINKSILHVLHGATGLPDDFIYKTIEFGTVKVNYSTELKSLTWNLINKFLAENKLFNEIKIHEYYLEILIPYFYNKILKLHK